MRCESNDRSVHLQVILRCRAKVHVPCVSSELMEGVVVEASRDLVSISQTPAVIPKGSWGEVLFIDDEGDAKIAFPRLPIEVETMQWLTQDDFARFRVFMH